MDDITRVSSAHTIDPSAGIRDVVIYFYRTLFNEHDVSVIDALVGADYRQHKPGIPDGPDAAKHFATLLFSRYPRVRVDVKRSAVDGDLVFLHSHMTFGDGQPGKAIADIFRVVDGKLVEHWGRRSRRAALRRARKPDVLSGSGGR